MKKIVCLTAFLAAVTMTFTACSDNTNSGIVQGSRGFAAGSNNSSDTSGSPVDTSSSNISNSSESSSSSDTSSSSESSSLSESSSSVESSSSSEISSSVESSSSSVISSLSEVPSSSEKPTVPQKPIISYTEGEIVDGKLDSDMLYTVANGETLCVASGETLLINGRLLCNNGAKIVIEEGGSLMLNGEIELSGELELLGEMAISNDAKVYGEGSMSLNSFNDIDCKGSFKAKIIPPEPVVIDGITYVGGVLVCNKKISLPSTYNPGLSSELQTALQKMRNGSGYAMPLVSGFRSYEYQKTVFKKWCDKDGEAVASTYSARPGHSEHQTGLAADITSIYQSYGNTKEGKWVAAHCHEYGFIVRYPLGKDDITGYMYEPWHLRYLGESTARLVHDSGLTLDEFLGVES